NPPAAGDYGVKPATNRGPPSKSNRCGAPATCKPSSALQARCNNPPAWGARRANSELTSGAAYNLPKLTMTNEARIRVSPLGGVGEVGKNSTLIEFDEDLLIVDAGVKFPETELHGVDLVVCDYTYVADRLENLLGIVFTHGHEDHIGGLPYLIMQ